MKKSTSLRKSALITSVIMLLVALTALSGATYAWFSSEPYAITDDIEMTTTAIQGLYLAEGNLGDAEPKTQYSSILKWTAPKGTFAPVSCKFTGNTDFYTTSSSLPDGTYDGASITKAVAFTFEIPNNANGSYFARKIWIKGDVAENETRTLLADFKQDGEATYHRIAIIDCDKMADGLTADDVMLIAPNSNPYYALDGEGVSDVQLTPSTERASRIMGTITGDEVKSYLVFFYFEGQDANCTTANSGQAVTAGITFRFADETTGE